MVMANNSQQSNVGSLKPIWFEQIDKCEYMGESLDNVSRKEQRLRCNGKFLARTWKYVRQIFFPKLKVT
jgi:hypothetical protein